MSEDNVRYRLIDMADWDLVGLARDGDMNAFEILVRRYQKPVIHFCWRMTGSQEEAEDLAQESFIRVYRHLARLQPRAQFSTVLFGIARNLTLNALRNAGRLGRPVARPPVSDPSSILEPGVPDNRPRPDESARLHELGVRIEEALALLSPEHREVLLLREFEGLDYDAIGRVIQARVGTVKSRLARAREQFRLRLLDVGGEW